MHPCTAGNSDSGTGGPAEKRLGPGRERASLRAPWSDLPPLTAPSPPHRASAHPGPRERLEEGVWHVTQAQGSSTQGLSGCPQTASGLWCKPEGGRDAERPRRGRSGRHARAGDPRPARTGDSRGPPSRQGAARLLPRTDRCREAPPYPRTGGVARSRGGKVL